MIGPRWRSRAVTNPRLMPSWAYLVHVVSGERVPTPSVPFNYGSRLTAGSADWDRGIASITGPPGSCERIVPAGPDLGEREQEQEAVSFVGSSSCVGGPGGRPGGIWGEVHPKVSSAVRSNHSAITSTDQPQNATVLLENPSDFARRSSLS